MAKETHFLGKVATKAIIVKDDKILLGRDCNDSEIWDLPGGRINSGEDIVTAVAREVQEELGVDVVFESVIYSEQLIHTHDGNHHLFITCKVNLVNPDQPFKIPSDEVAEITWVDKKTVHQIKTYDNVTRALEMYWSKNN